MGKQGQIWIQEIPLRKKKKQCRSIYIYPVYQVSRQCSYGNGVEVGFRMGKEDRSQSAIYYKKIKWNV